MWEGHQKRTQRNIARGTGFTANLANLDKPSNTLVSRYYKDGKECLIPQEGKNPRKLTPRECARLQGFPEEFILPKSNAAAYRQFGNSVAVPVIDAIAKNIVDKLKLMTDNTEKFKEAGFKRLSDLTEWEKCYWYLRILIDTNRYGALAKDKTRIKNIQENLLTSYKIVIHNEEIEANQLEILHSVLKQTLFYKVEETSKKYMSYEALITQLDSLLIKPKDYFVFAIAIKELLIPTNDAINEVPTNQSTDFARTYAKAVLDTKKEKGLSNLIREWDIFTESLSLNKERDLIVQLYRNIKNNFQEKIKKFNETTSENELDTILTAICQEYERRVGQKRKQRAGEDLESSIEFIFNYFNLKTVGEPEHFTAGLELDNWVKDKKGWYIGVSLKRTLRERWKQTYTTETGLYDRYKIKHIIHIINNDFDLSDSTITELGAYRHLFFLADDSSVLKEKKSHIAMGKYLFPMSELISKVKELMK